MTGPRAHAFSVWIGYDPRVLASLPSAARDSIARLAEAWLFGALCLSLPLGYACFLLVHAYELSVLVSLGTWLFLVNLLRLSSAGGGAAPSDAEDRVRARTPSLAPAVWFAMLGLLFAQPAQLVFSRGELDPLVAVARRELSSAHTAALALRRAEERVLGETAQPDRYAAELVASEFLVLRLRGLWNQPVAATRFTLLFLAIVLVPGLVARAHARSSLVAYELARWRIQRALVADDAARTDAAVARALTRFPSFVPRAIRDPFAGHAEPLNMIWPVQPEPRASLWRRLWRRRGRA